MAGAVVVAVRWAMLRQAQARMQCAAARAAVAAVAKAAALMSLALAADSRVIVLSPAAMQAQLDRKAVPVSVIPVAADQADRARRPEERTAATAAFRAAAAAAAAAQWTGKRLAWVARERAAKFGWSSTRTFPAFDLCQTFRSVCSMFSSWHLAQAIGLSPLGQNSFTSSCSVEAEAVEVATLEQLLEQLPEGAAAVAVPEDLRHGFLRLTSAAPSLIRSLLLARPAQLVRAQEESLEAMVATRHSAVTSFLCTRLMAAGVEGTERLPVAATVEVQDLLEQAAKDRLVVAAQLEQMAAWERPAPTTTTAAARRAARHQPA
jgi:hypothetical protein